MFVSFQDFVGKTRNFSVWMLARFSREEGYTWHRKFGHKWNLILEICSLVNCLSPVKAEHCIFWTVEYFVDGRNKENRISKIKINWIVCQSVIFCQAELKEVNFEHICWQCHHHWKLFNSFDELLSSLELNNSKNFQLVNCWSLVKLWNTEQYFVHWYCESLHQITGIYRYHE